MFFGPCHGVPRPTGRNACPSALFRPSRIRRSEPCSNPRPNAGNARIDYVRALVRLRSDPAEEPSRHGAVETLVTARGLAVEEAESVLNNRMLPAKPFSPL